MNRWNYRVLKKDGVLAVYTIYYDENGNIKGWSANPFSPEAEDIEELRTNLELMLESLKDEIIKVD